MKAMKAILIVILILAIALAAVILYSRATVTDGPGMEFELKPYSGDKLEECMIKEASGELDMLYSLDLVRMADGWAMLTVRDREAHNTEENVYEYLLDDEIVDKIQELAESCGALTWKDLPPAEEFTLDAPTTYYTFKIKGETIRFSDEKQIPTNGWEALREIQELLEAEYTDKL